MIPFLIASALGGLFALVMPCVWPMVPITVNFFVKQGQGTGGDSKATGLAFMYCLSIIGVFTAVGVLFSFFFSALVSANAGQQSLAELCSSPASSSLFGLSLLGLFELRLPSFLLNASAQGESRGGLVGVFFMALTLTITSFTCTFPVVGGLLVMAAGGDFFYPIVGLATFAAVLALPFFLLALSPGLISKMPRSGDWMNAVKVVGGLVEIGAALKFINTAELALRHSGKRLVRRPGRPDVLDRALAVGLRPLPAGRVPHRPRPRRRQGRPRPDHLRRAVPGPGPLHGARPVRPAAAEPGLGPADRRHPAARFERRSARRSQVAGGRRRSVRSER